MPEDSSAAEAGEQVHKTESKTLLMMAGLLVLTVLLMWLFKRQRIRGLHETGVSMLMGMLAGFIIDRAERSNPDYSPPPCNATLQDLQDGRTDSVEDEATFDPEIFFFVLLPPIIFYAGYDLKQKHFFRNIAAILTYAFIGTTAATFITGFMLYFFNNSIQDVGLTLLDCLSFGAFISATDPVTVLAIYHDLHVDFRLFAIVFGESVMNDAVALVLFSTLEQMREQDATAGNVLFAMFVFIVIFMGSFACGCFVGMVTSILMKFTRIGEFPLLESTMFVLLSYMTFLLGEAAGLSGIVAVLFCGMCQAHYTYPNMSKESQRRTKEFFELLNLMAENFIFSYIGLSFFTYKCHQWNASFIGWSVITILVARAAIVYPLSWMMNRTRKSKSKIPINFQHCLWCAGLRGAIAFALAMRNAVGTQNQMILSTTLVIVLVTVLFFGGSTVSVLQFLKVRVGVHDEPPPPPGTRSTAEKGCLARNWQGFDKKYLRPVLTRTEDDWGTHSWAGVLATLRAYWRGEPELGKPVNAQTGYIRGPVDSDGASSDAESTASSDVVSFDDDAADDWGGGDLGGGGLRSSNKVFAKAGFDDIGGT